ncbi:formylglycine-generating enzyme family protein [Naumannella huperziae]
MSESPGSAPAELIEIAAGPFAMGSDSPRAHPADGEGPVRTVTLSAYRISPTAVTNAEFAAFVDATGYRTEAEGFGWSYVFGGMVAPDAVIMDAGVPGAPWWRAVRGADWAHPEGGRSGIGDRLDHPVVQVSWHDAQAYCRWRGVRLPTEAEWEKAARGGLVGATYAWGDEVSPGGEHRANIWQGTFPEINTAEDGYAGTAPVTAYPPNGYGLHNTAGNVWEWCADWFSARWHVQDIEQTRVDPQGPRWGMARVVRGGSYLCHSSYCNRYRVAARTQTTPDSALGHTGFRVAADA